MRQQTFEEFTEDKLKVLKRASFYDGPVTDPERQRIWAIENHLEEYREKIKRGLLREDK